MQRLDGNAMAGDLADVFGGDLTAVTGSCAHCGDRAFLAEMLVYRSAMGSVGRCRSCDAVLVVHVLQAGRARVSLGGVRVLEASDR